MSVIVPAYNEKDHRQHPQVAGASTHPIEVIVVDDGSTDGTSEIARDAAEALGMTNVRVIRQENAGKPAALNNGVRSELRHRRDDGRDTVFEADTVGRLVQPFADPEVGAVAGNAKVGNRDTVIGAWQHIEYVLGFNLDRRMYDLLRCMPTIPGAIGASAARRSSRSAGSRGHPRRGHRHHHRHAPRGLAGRLPGARPCLDRGPGSLKQLWSQRYRWSYGTMQALWKHRKSLTDKGPSGRFGRVGMPLVVVFQIVTLLGDPPWATRGANRPGRSSGTRGRTSGSCSCPRSC
ncbi:Glycosyltransferase OS=Streptomyces alboniger OX=132473 GN=CP975_13395 PE=4 SV=1 [Streptomyces alboniger]